MAKKRRHRPTGDDLDASTDTCWQGIREQWRLEDQHHSTEENAAAHARGRAWTEGLIGWDELSLCRQTQETPPA